jgi:hypothetical protein
MRKSQKTFLVLSLIAALGTPAEAYEIARGDGGDWVIHCRNGEDFPLAGSESIREASDTARQLCHELKFKPHHMTTDSLT